MDPPGICVFFVYTQITLLLSNIHSTQYVLHTCIKYEGKLFLEYIIKHKKLTLHSIIRWCTYIREGYFYLGEFLRNYI